MLRLELYKGNIPQLNQPITDDGKKPTASFYQLLDQIVNRIWTDVYVGSGVPDSSLGVAGDLYINLSALTYYIKTVSGWGSSTALDNNENAILLISRKQ